LETNSILNLIGFLKTKISQPERLGVLILDHLVKELVAVVFPLLGIDGALGGGGGGGCCVAVA
jgi:hypothetical protein